MKYIKPFNEGSYEEGVKEFIQMYISDIIDRGGVYVRVDNTRLNSYNYIVTLSLGLGIDMKTWGSMKDTLLPFFEMFIREYGEISDITLLGKTYSYIDTISCNDLLNDNYLSWLSDDELVRMIKFRFN